MQNSWTKLHPLFNLRTPRRAMLRRLLSPANLHHLRTLASSRSPVPSRLAARLNRSYSALRDAELVEVLLSEIKHEQSSNIFQNHLDGSLENFELEWDGTQSGDVVLRRRNGPEEIYVSAMLGPEGVQGGDSLTRSVLMKVFITKPGSSPVLQFDCGISNQGDHGTDFHICNAYYLPTSSCFGASNYRGPSFRTLDPSLQKAFKMYLIDRGISVEFTDFLLLHLHKKEQGQYVNWLQKLEKTVSKDA